MIQVLKLQTGEEVIGDVTETSTGYQVKKPCQLQWMPSRNNPEMPMMALVPYAIHVEGHEIEINSSVVVWKAKPVKDLYNQYNSAFGSGIVVAQ